MGATKGNNAVISWHNAVVAMALTVLYWVVISASVGYVGAKLPLVSLARRYGSYRIFSFERGGTFYERYLKVRRWKRYLPEAGDIFEGGVSKRSLALGVTDAKLRFYLETKRAEFVHRYLILLELVPTFVWFGFFHEVVVAYAVLANVPCLVAQRYNRARLERIYKAIETEALSYAERNIGTG
ncbi:hypothetical protein [Ferrithrix thermotolerans]|uniref:glycosyl-4,4'-diaponeurosporenoate acyltransferase CrtO family protein n=1 Tax=Ferrithrix thermotolerans TaxID=209649 RepID=UPI0011601F01|nr:hypothetical protein [Ferrithrix thermotolerans]